MNASIFRNAVIDGSSGDDKGSAGLYISARAINYRIPVNCNQLKTSEAIRLIVKIKDTITRPEIVGFQKVDATHQHLQIRGD